MTQLTEQTDDKTTRLYLHNRFMTPSTDPTGTDTDTDTGPKLLLRFSYESLPDTAL